MCLRRNAIQHVTAAIGMTTAAAKGGTRRCSRTVGLHSVLTYRHDTVGAMALVSTLRCGHSSDPLTEALGETERSHLSATSRRAGSTVTACSTTSAPRRTPIAGVDTDKFSVPADDGTALPADLVPHIGRRTAGQRGAVPARRRHDLQPRPPRRDVRARGATYVAEVRGADAGGRLPRRARAPASHARRGLLRRAGVARRATRTSWVSIRPASR